jgi:hypothetical protein
MVTQRQLGAYERCRRAVIEQIARFADKSRPPDSCQFNTSWEVDDAFCEWIVKQTDVEWWLDELGADFDD